MKRREFLTAASVAGGGVAASASAAAAQEGTETQEGTPTNQGTPEGTATGEGGGDGGGGGNTWTVEMNDQNQFVPNSVTVRPGDTVVWENVGSAPHSVTAYGGEIPDGAEYWASGGFDSEEAARQGWDEGSVEGGETYEHTFQTEGTHQYFCIPHEQLDMVGEVQVSPDAPTPTQAPAAAGGGQHQDPEHWGVPFQAHYVGTATALMVLASLIYSFFVLKYGESANIQGGND